MVHHLADGNGGPIARYLTTGLWRVMRAIVPHRRQGVLSLAGPLLLTVTVLTWVGLVWAGWAFIFAAGDQVLMNTIETGTYADRSGYTWFVAQAMFTMGNGDFTPQGDWAQMAGSLTTASGTLLTSLIISYVIAVLSAVVKKRAFATTVMGLGRESESLLLHAWNGRDFHTLDLTLSTLSSELTQLGQQHVAYPILHYYHTARRQTASSVSLAIFDEALTLLRFGVPEAYRPNPVLLHSAREGVSGYIQSLRPALIRPAQELPRLPISSACVRPASPSWTTRPLRRH